MKRKICLILALLLLLVPSAANADSTGILHVAVNDRLYDLGVRPAFIGTPIVVFLPYSSYSDLGLLYSYDYVDGIATISDGTASIDFDMTDGGQAYDALGSPISAVSAQFINGQIYLPTQFICDLFGMRYSLIPGVGYGDVIRISNDDALLDDKTFLTAYTYTMRERWYAYAGITPATPSPSPSGSPSPSPEIDRSDITIFMSFAGLPTEDVLNLLDRYAVSTCFLLTADDVAADPDIIRRAVNLGHDVGALCGNDALEDFREISSLISESARRVPIHVGASEESAPVEALAEQAPVVCLDYDIDATSSTNASALILLLDDLEDNAHLRFSTNNTQTPVVLGTILNYLNSRKYDLQDCPYSG